jgi:putative tryptophan/tyrosine transport system substrate-binding protein
MKRREFILALGGAAASLPLAASAQQPAKIPTIGILWHAGTAEQEGPNFTAVIEGFKALGYVDGRNIRFEHRFPNETPDRFRSMAAELVSMKVDVLMSVGVAAAPYVKSATSTIPIVFALVADPVASKLVDSLAKPGGNATGLTLLAAELGAKRLELLKEAVPGLSRVGLLVNPNTSFSRPYIEESKAAAAKLGLALQTFEAHTLDELEPAFDMAAKAGVQAISITPEGMFYQGRANIAKLALSRGIATCVWSRETFEPGAFMAYGPDVLAILRHAAFFVDKILKGVKPADLPVEEPTRFQLLISLKTAKAIGITVPPTLLTRADEVIE